MKMLINKKLKKRLIIGGVSTIFLFLCYVIIPKMIIASYKEYIQSRISEHADFPDDETIRIMDQLTLFESWPLHSLRAHECKEYAVLHYYPILKHQLNSFYEDARDSSIAEIEQSTSEYASKELQYEAELNVMVDAASAKLGTGFKINGKPWWDLVDSTKLPELCKWKEFVEQYNIFIKNEHYALRRNELNFSFCEEM